MSALERDRDDISVASRKRSSKLFQSVSVRWMAGRQARY